MEGSSEGNGQDAFCFPPAGGGNIALPLDKVSDRF